MEADPMYERMATAPDVPEMSRDALNTLGNLEAVAVRQDLQWLEEIITCWEVRNKYKISSIPLGQENSVFTDLEMKNLPTAFDVREDSTLCCRLCCANNRQFTIGLFPPDTPLNPKWPLMEPLLKLERPFKCSCWFGRCYCPQQLHVSADGQHLGSVEHDCRCLDCCFCCTCWVKSYNADGNPLHAFKAGCCGKNCCAPSCCNRVFEIDIVDANNESKVLGWMRNIWPGWNWRGLCSPSASNFVLKFPENASREEKAVLLGSLFLIDFLLFEKQNDNGGDGGGA